MTPVPIVPNPIRPTRISSLTSSHSPHTCAARRRAAKKKGLHPGVQPLKAIRPKSSLVAKHAGRLGLTDQSSLDHLVADTHAEIEDHGEVLAVFSIRRGR